MKLSNKSYGTAALVAMVSVVVLVLVAAAVLMWPREKVYVGEAGLHLDGEGNLHAIIDTCGESIASFEVMQDGELLSVFEADEPFSGVADEIVGESAGVEPHPSPWLQTVEKSPNIDARPESESYISLTVRLHDVPDTWHHRAAEASIYTLDKYRGERIVHGEPHKSGDQSIFTHERFSEQCSEPLHSETNLLWEWLLD